MPTKRDDALILDAGLRQSLTAVRSLGRRGLGVAALELEPLAQSVPTFSSRWCGKKYVAPSFERDPAPFVEFLERVLDERAPRVVIPSGDGTVSVMRRFRARLERRARIALAHEEALANAVDKERTLSLARRLGLAVPVGVHIRRSAEVPAALREVGLPAVVKPVESWVSGGDRPGARLFCQLVATLDEALRAVDERTRAGGTVLIQQFLSGEREAVSLLYANGEVHARFAQWAKRMQPPLGGTSVFRQSIAVPEDIGADAERLVRAIDLEGYSEVEFRRDSRGRAYLMEINPRLSASVEVAVRAGVDFPLLLYQWAAGERIDRVTAYRVGGWMRHLEGDLQTTLQCFSQRGRPGVTPPARAVLDFAASFLVPSGYDYVSWDDLAPALEAARSFGRTVLRQMRRPLFLAALSVNRTDGCDQRKTE
jgi:predicted ATP-grasp superfamily ATP-dependent carboligase